MILAAIDRVAESSEEGGSLGDDSSTSDARQIPLDQLCRGAGRADCQSPYDLVHDFKRRSPCEEVVNIVVHIAAIRSLDMPTAVFQNVAIRVEHCCGESEAPRFLQSVGLGRHFAQNIEGRSQRSRVRIRKEQIYRFPDRIAGLRWLACGCTAQN